VWPVYSPSRIFCLANKEGMAFSRVAVQCNRDYIDDYVITTPEFRLVRNPKVATAPATLPRLSVYSNNNTVLQGSVSLLIGPIARAALLSSKAGVYKLDPNTPAGDLSIPVLRRMRLTSEAASPDERDVFRSFRLAIAMLQEFAWSLLEQKEADPVVIHACIANSNVWTRNALYYQCDTSGPAPHSARELPFGFGFCEPCFELVLVVRRKGECSRDAMEDPGPDGIDLHADLPEALCDLRPEPH
jgi:hypothetical protein